MTTSSALPILASRWIVARPGTGEARLIRRAQAGDASALEALYRSYWPQAYRTAYLIVHDHAGAEDIAQEAFLSAVRALDRFDRRRRFGPWLARIVANRAIDWSRARVSRREVADASLERTEDPRQEVSDVTVSALRSLSPERRALVVLRYLLDWTPGEIAAALDLPRGTVNSRLRRALDALEPVLAEEGR